MASEFRWAVRRLTKEPVYAISVIITLAIGLLLFTVTFAIIDGVLFQPLPYPGSRELFVFQPTATSERNQASAKLTWPEVEALRLAAPGGQVAAVRFLPAPYEVVALRRNFWAAVVDDRFFEVLGYSPLIGAFERDDFFWTPETELGRVFQPVIISHRLWGLLFNNQHDIISRRVTFAERMGSTWGIRVVGVLPQDFVFPLDLGGPQPDFLLPLTHDARRGKERHFASIARLGPDADPPSLRSALLAALSKVDLSPGTRHKGNASPLDLRIIPLQRHLGQDERPLFQLAIGCAAFLLILSCVSAATLTVGRNQRLQREFVMKVVLGAGRGRLIKGQLIEAGVLVVGASTLAMVLSGWFLHTTQAFLPDSTTLLKIPAVDYRVLIAAALMAVWCILLVGLWPTGLGLLRALERQSVQFPDRLATPRVRSSLFSLAIETAIGLALVLGASLLVASFLRAFTNDAGYRRDRMLLIEAAADRYDSPGEATQMLQRAVSRIAACPGVSGVALSSIQPLFARQSTPWSTVKPVGWSTTLPQIAGRHVSVNYFNVMQIRLRRGRLPSQSEWDADAVAVVSATAARLLWDGAEPIGKMLEPISPEPGLPARRHMVIGVVADARYVGLDQDAIADIYLPGPIRENTAGLFIIAETTHSSRSVLKLVLSAAGSTPVKIHQATTFNDALVNLLKPRLLPVWLFGWFGCAALLILALGSFSLGAMATARRYREVGIRMALGASRWRLIILLLREQLRAVALGVVAGCLVALWALKYIESLLYGVQPYDLAIWGVVIATVMGAALLGAVIPARWAVATNAIITMRLE